jgi:hypothetical protein
MHLLERLKEWRASRREERDAIARAHQEQARAGDEPERSQADTVEDVANQFPAN